MKRRIFLLSFTAMTTLAACAGPRNPQTATNAQSGQTAPVNSSIQIPQPQAGQGLIVLYRPSSALAAVLRMPITVDGTPIGSLANGGFLTRSVPPGQYLVQTTAPSVAGVSNVSVSLSAGQTVYIRGETALGYPTGRAKLFQVSAGQAKSEIAKM